MDLETFKKRTGLNDYEDYDEQIEENYNAVVSKHIESETNYEEKIIFGTLCFLENINPELVGKVDSYKIADVSVVINSIGSLGANPSFCKLYKILVRSGINNFNSSSGARGSK
jgi:hypothetical protein